MKIRKILVLTMLVIFVFNSFAPFYNKASANATSQVVKDNIAVPNPIATANGVKYYASGTSGELGTVDISSLNLPSTANVTSVVLTDSNGKYIKNLFDHTGNVYRIGTVTSTDKVTVSTSSTSGVGYFEWWQVGSNNKHWAYDLDGVRHVREFSTNTTYPIAEGKYSNIQKSQVTLPTTWYVKGNRPSWYSASHANYLKVFDDETSGKANIGWAERNIPITGLTFSDKSGLGISVSVAKLANIDAKVSYVNPGLTGSLAPSAIIDTIIMDNSATMIANKKVKLWFSAKMGSNVEKTVSPNGLNMLTYYNQWKIDLTSNLYKYDTYKVVVNYEGTPVETLRIEGAGPVCLNEAVQFNAILSIPGIGDDNANSYVTWKSSDTSVATVTNGLVKGLKSGETTITATYTSTENKLQSSATKKIQIVQCGDVELTVNGEFNGCPKIGSTLQLHSSIQKKTGYKWDFLITEPHAKLVYTSSNSSIATVSSTGLITLVGEGSATITITYTEGDGSAPVTKTKSVVVSLDGNCTPPPPVTETCEERGDCPPTPPPTSNGACSYVISSSGVVGTMNNSSTNDITPTGIIESQSGEFNVVDGIPSSEYLRTEATTPEYLCGLYS